jgi:[ribosomal protein S18]-alanine N-acetyltransferase
MPLTLRYMHPNDVPQVVAIDELSFPDAWSYRSYMFELNESQVSHMVVLQDGTTPLPPPRPNRWQRFWHRLQRRAPHMPDIAPYPTILAYGGMWNIHEEAHISTIATHPTHRGKGYGEVVLAGMVQKALRLNAEYIVLEVRVSNHVAQALYYKYGFESVNTNRGYYRDGEDAYDMRLHIDMATTPTKVLALASALQQKVPHEDLYSTGKNARLGM